MGVDNSVEATALSETTHNSNDLAEFLAYVRAKIAYVRRFGAGYRQECHRAYRWHQYVQRQRSDTKLVRHVQAYVVDPGNTVLFYGDWSSSHQLKHYISTPCLRVRRLVVKAFPRMYLLDEFKTSKLYWRDPTVRLKPYVTTTAKRPLQFSIHSLLTLNGDDTEGRVDANGQSLAQTLGNVRINRDKNAVHNFRTIVHHQLSTGTRPAAFCRTNEG
jgi:hypothetical protein